MATLQVRDIDNRLYELLKMSSKTQKRSISQEVVIIIENYLNSPHKKTANATLEFLSLTGSWMDEKSADEIVSTIKDNRVESDRFGASDGLFD